MKMKNITIRLVTIALFVLLLFSQFKNISYPLMWEDEAMSAVGAGVVLEYGYPKVHGEKNILYDFLHTDPTIGINEKDDSFAASSSWGQYYFGTIGYLLAQNTDDIYTKTAIIRSTYAILGLLGIAFLVFVVIRLLTGKLEKNFFILLFLLLSLISVSLVLHLREVRYYSLVVFLTSIIMGIYIWFRFYKTFNKPLFIASETIALWLLFVSFSPAYFITLVTIGVSELFIFITAYRKTNFSKALKAIYSTLTFVALSLISIIPMLIQFKYFEISQALTSFFGYNSTIYWRNVSDIFDYFRAQDFLLLAIAMKVFVLFNVRKIFIQRLEIFKVSAFLTLFFLISCLVLPRNPQFMYTRYVIYLIPVLFSTIILDLFMVLHVVQTKNPKTSFKFVAPLITFALFFFYTLGNNLHNIKGHVYEMGHQFKGPLDYTIPYIKEHFHRADTLTIAANYEEYSYIYYLDSKVIIGYVGNNLQEDAQLTPDVVAYRKPWQNHLNVFNGYLQQAVYEPVAFPVYDAMVNNIPELHSMYPMLNHRFKTQLTENPQEMTYLYINKKLVE